MSKIAAAPRALALDGRDVIMGTGAILDAPDPGDAGLILDRLATRLGDNGQVLITRTGPSWAYLTDGGRDWKVTGGPAWYTARHEQSQVRLRIGVIENIPPSNDPLLGENLLTTTMRHQMFIDLTGVPFYGDGGTTATVLMDATIKVRGRDPLRKWEDRAAPAVPEDAWPGGGVWETRLRGEYHPIVTLDRNAQYLAGVNGTYLPMDAPSRTGPIPFDSGLAGLWQIRTPANPERRLPHPAGRNVTAPGLRWCATPTVMLLEQLGCAIEVIDSWTCPRDRCRRALDPWYRVLRDARAALLDAPDPDSAALMAAVKDTYSRGISHLARDPGRRWYRPDWKAILYAAARTSMWRSLYQAGQMHDVWPVVIKADAAVFDRPDAPAAFRVGTGMGEWKVQP